MLILIVAALQVGTTSSVPPLPRVPPPPPPFSHKVEAAALRIGARINDEFKRCSDARANSNARYVEAMGTDRFSAEWRKAALAMQNALTVCRALRRSLRDQEDFLVRVAQSLTRHDGNLAVGQLVGVSSELEATEQYFVTETPRYRALLTDGWGDPHCDAGPLTGFERPAGICANSSGAPR